MPHYCMRNVVMEHHRRMGQYLDSGKSRSQMMSGDLDEGESEKIGQDEELKTQSWPMMKKTHAD